jgi:hypothetical protein
MISVYLEIKWTLTNRRCMQDQSIEGNGTNSERKLKDQLSSVTVCVQKTGKILCM